MVIRANYCAAPAGREALRFPPLGSPAWLNAVAQPRRKEWHSASSNAVSERAALRPGRRERTPRADAQRAAPCAGRLHRRALRAAVSLRSPDRLAPARKGGRADLRLPVKCFLNTAESGRNTNQRVPSMVRGRGLLYWRVFVTAFARLALSRADEIYTCSWFDYTTSN